jgi:hypothetical protein
MDSIVDSFVFDTEVEYERHVSLFKISNFLLKDFCLGSLLILFRLKPCKFLIIQLLTAICEKQKAFKLLSIGLSSLKNSLACSLRTLK